MQIERIKKNNSLIFLYWKMKLVCKDYYMVKLQRNPQSGYTQITDSFIIS